MKPRDKLFKNATGAMLLLRISQQKHVGPQHGFNAKYQHNSHASAGAPTPAEAWHHEPSEKSSMKRRGYMLMELVVYVALLAMFTLIASKLFITCMRLAQDTRKTQDAIWRFDGAIRQLRQDVWSSNHIKSQNKESVLLEQPNGPAIHWYVDEDKTLVRRVEKEPAPLPQRWPGGKETITFDTHSGILRLIECDAHGHETNQIPLVCPLEADGSKP